MRTVHEDARDVPVAGEYDVVVCGGGPAGVGAAVTAARAGARVALVEANGCLGGIWTAGLMAHIIDAEGKGGLVEHVMAALAARGAKGLRHDYEVEATKLLLEELCIEAGVRVRLHTRTAAAVRDAANRLTTVVTESKSGREAWCAKAFVDATGDGDLAAQAGCGFDLGREASAQTQPMSLIAVVAGIRLDEVREYTNAGAQPGISHKKNLLALLTEAGAPPSYSHPTLFHLRDDLFTLMSNHEYGVCAFDADHVTEATLRARAELHRQMAALRACGGPWRDIHIVATSEQIGTREGRRIHGRYTVSAEDITGGARHADAVCRATFCVDVHSTDPNADKGLGNEGLRVQPYDIPLRALVARDVDGLLLAGRCISGDFVSHASYRVTGNAVALGEAAGFAAAKAALTGQPAHELAWPSIAAELDALRRYT